MSEDPRHAGRSERRSIVLVTSGFIIASAALHIVLGGAAPAVRFPIAANPSVPTILIATLQTPPPAPRPTPRPSPTPTATQRAVQPKPLSRAPRPQATRIATPPRDTAALRTPASTALVGSLGPPATDVPVEVSPQPSAPADDRYVIVSARFEHEVRPEYPHDAFEQGEEGTVIILLTVGPDGPSDIRVWVSSGYASLDRAALMAAQESSYSAPEHNGEPVTETYRIIYTFSLDT
ncbi:MAG: energy transducer TonB [Candidatus Eremiobacteraeota bacterium]|nr:energy transducer TonB [Candidatus Eremiobacteraeota bacterium]